jgi:hypothetical protein
MSTLQIARNRGGYDPNLPRVLVSSAGLSTTAKAIEDRLRALTNQTPTFSGLSRTAHDLPEKLYDALAAFKIRTSIVAMHLDDAWRSRLFQQLDNLLSVEDWDANDAPPGLASYSTFLRMMLVLRPVRRPGLGATSDGHLVAAWTVDSDRLTIECMPNDTVRWWLSVIIDEEKDSAAGVTGLNRLKEVLTPYGPNRWFERGNNVHPA